MNTSATLPQLRELSNQIRDLGISLKAASVELGEENVAFVVGTSAELEHFMSRLSITPESPDPLGSRELRHDLRNKVAVVKGFSDLMRMDLSPNHRWANLLDRLIMLSDQFVEVLDSARDRSPSDCGAAIFA